MAALRLASRALLRSALASAPMRQGIATTAICQKDVKMPHSLDHAVGLEKLERIAKLVGIDDMFGLGPLQLGKGTKEEPTIIPSTFNKRLIGHQCEDDQTYLTYFYVYKGFPKRCQCGHWFKLVDAPDLAAIMAELDVSDLPEDQKKQLEAAMS